MASLASNFGGLVQAVGAAWMMTSMTTSADMVALVQASTTLPIMIFSLAAGALADNFPRRGVMLTAQLFMLAISVALAVAAWMDLLTPWALLGFTFLIGCGTRSTIRRGRPRSAISSRAQHLPAAVALNSVGFNLTRCVGPAIGGAIVAAAGAAAAFAVNAMSYFALIAVLVRWRPELPERLLPRESLGAAMGAGLRYVAMSPNILKVLVRAFLFGLTLDRRARAAAARRPPPRAGRAARLRRVARRLRRRRGRRRRAAGAAARPDVERGDRAPRLRGLRRLLARPRR